MRSLSTRLNHAPDHCQSFLGNRAATSFPRDQQTRIRIIGTIALSSLTCAQASLTNLTALNLQKRFRS